MSFVAKVLVGPMSRYKMLPLWVVALASSGIAFADPMIALSDSSLSPIYGQQYSVQLSVSDSYEQVLSWQIAESSLPAGLELVGADQSVAAIQGMPVFTDQWCTTIVANGSQGVLASRELCFNGIDSSQFYYPRFDGDQNLLTGTVGTYYSSTIGLVTSSVQNGFSVEVYDGALPAGLNIQGLQNATVLIDGTPQEQGYFRFALSLKDPTGEYYSYRQYQLTVNPAAVIQPVNPQISYPVPQPIGYPVYIPRPIPSRLPGLSYPIHPGPYPGFDHNLHRQPPQVCAPSLPGRFGYPHQGGGFGRDHDYRPAPGPQYNPRPFPGPQGPGGGWRPQPQGPFPGHGGPGVGPGQPSFPGRGGPGVGPGQPSFPGHGGPGVGPGQPSFPGRGGPGAGPGVGPGRGGHH